MTHNRLPWGVVRALVFLLLSATTASAQNYEYTSVFQPNLAQIGVTKTLHNDLKALISKSKAAKNVGIAILDGRSDSTHPDLKGRLTVSTVYRGSYRQYDDHGTHVAGIAGAGQNSKGIVGVAPTAKLYSIPVFDDNGWVASDLGRAALNKAVALGAKVANMSYGPMSAGDVFLSGELNIFDDFKSSMVLVRAAGNDGVDAWNESYSFDASDTLSHLLIVGSVDGGNDISSFSNRPGAACIGSAGCAADDMLKNFFIVAPGEDIASDMPGKSYAYMSGTSMASPHVAGAAALVFQQALASKQTLTPTQVAAILKQSATDLGNAGVDGVYGWGLLDVAAALSPVGGTFMATGSSVDAGLVPLTGSSISRSSVLGSSRAIEKAMGGMVVFDGFQRAFVVENPQLEGADSTLATDAVAGLNSSLSYKSVELGAYGSYQLTLHEGGGMAEAANVLSFASEDYRITTGLGTAKAFFTQGVAVPAGAYSQTLGATFFQGAGDAGTALENAMFAGGDYQVAPGRMLSVLYMHGADELEDASGSAAQSVDLLKMGSQMAMTDSVSMGVSYGLLREEGQLLGMESAGGMALGEVGLTQLAGVQFEARLDARTRLSGFAEVSLSSASGNGDSLFSSPSDWRGSRMGLALSRSGVAQAGDVVSVSVIRPWRIDEGDVDALVATGREWDGTVIYEARSASLGTDEVPIDLGLSYVKAGGVLGYGASVWLRDNDVRSLEPDEVSVAAAMSWNF